MKYRLEKFSVENINPGLVTDIDILKESFSKQQAAYDSLLHKAICSCPIKIGYVLQFKHSYDLSRIECSRRVVDIKYREKGSKVFGLGDFIILCKKLDSSLRVVDDVSVEILTEDLYDQLLNIYVPIKEDEL